MLVEAAEAGRRPQQRAAQQPGPGPWRVAGQGCGGPLHALADAVQLRAVRVDAQGQGGQVLGQARHPGGPGLQSAHRRGGEEGLGGRVEAAARKAAARGAQRGPPRAAAPRGVQVPHQSARRPGCALQSVLDDLDGSRRQ